MFGALNGWFLGTNVVWLCLHRAAPHWDDSWYLTNSLRMFDALTREGISGYARQFLTILETKSPLITRPPTPVYLILGRHLRYAYIVNLSLCPSYSQRFIRSDFRAQTKLDEGLGRTIEWYRTNRIRT